MTESVLDHHYQRLCCLQLDRAQLLNSHNTTKDIMTSTMQHRLRMSDIRRRIALVMFTMLTLVMTVKTAVALHIKLN